MKFEDLRKILINDPYFMRLQENRIALNLSVDDYEAKSWSDEEKWESIYEDAIAVIQHKIAIEMSKKYGIPVDFAYSGFEPCDDKGLLTENEYHFWYFVIREQFPEIKKMRGSLSSSYESIYKNPDKD